MGGAAFAGRRRLECFADFRLRHQRNIARNFTQRSYQQSQCGSYFGEPVAVRVPWNARKFQLQFFRKSARDCRAVCSQRGERADCATKLKYENLLAHSCESGTVAIGRV